MSRRIALTRGYVALVDDADYDRVAAVKWYAHVTKDGVYAARNEGGRKNRRCVLMHRLLLGLGPGEYGDHRNGDGLDNRRANLRSSTNAENCRNHHSTRGHSRFRGVSWSRAAGKWVAWIKVNYRNLYLGVHRLEEDAARAYDRAARQHFGEFASLNFPGEVS